MKFLVVVSGKHIVTVEATSNGGAEHKILDNYTLENPNCVQAFKPEEANIMFEMFPNAETTSIEHIAKISKAIEADMAVGEITTQLEVAKEEYEKLVAKLNKKLDEAKAKREEYTHLLPVRR
jgi:hypothetical protein